MAYKLPKYRTGNVLKTKHGYIIIITDIKTGTQHPNDDYYTWVSFSSSNSSGGTYFTTTQTIELCTDLHCGCACDDEDCEVCGGTGEYIRTNYGLDQAILLGDCVKGYILDKLTSNFNF